MTIMQTYRGIVRKGRIQLTPPTDLPEGSEVYIVVTGEGVSETAVSGNLYISPDRPAMQREQAAFKEMLPQLLTQYKNQYVAIYQGEVVDHDEDQVALVIRLDRNYPDAVVLVQKVTAEPKRVLRMPSPRLVRSD